MTLEKVLRYCRFPRHLRGYRELEDCVRIVLEDEDRLLYVTGIYREVGKKYQVSASGVERNIRTLVTHAWRNGGKESMEIIAGCKLVNKPTSSEVIEMLACHLMEQHKDSSLGA